MISENEKLYLRELAKKQKELACLPIMEERKRLWYLHNALKGERPMVVMEEGTFLEEILPPLKCQSEDGRRIERQLLQTILPEQLFQDDKVVTDEFRVEVMVDFRLFDIALKKIFASDGVGFHIDPAFEYLEGNLGLLKESVFTYDRDETLRRKAVAEEVLGDILNVRLVNTVNCWSFALTEHIVFLMGMENMFCAMKTEEDEFHMLMSRLVEEMIHFLRWQEKQDILFLNNGNDYMGSGSFCFSTELPGADFNGKVLSKHVWGHLNSQESIGISPEMYHEFIAPYYRRMADEFGLLYYGCCEPVELYWDQDISKYPNLRKVSISPWCNEEFMAERLAAGNVIYSRKPSPNFLGVKKEFDEDAFRKYIRHTAELTKGGKTEYIFRDIYKLHGNLEKLRKAVQIVREETNR
ncbi:MAG: hypothetical protein MR308_07035 [Lachnospiraceae bacterium]|nr:hypothetical protein [Lachnospiraceae bacterium]